MNVCIFLYNVVSIKTSLLNLTNNEDCKFILIGSDYCLSNLSEDNRRFFDEIHCVNRNFHQIDCKEVETILLGFLKLYSASNIKLLTNEDSTQLVCAALREKYHIPGNSTEQLLPFVNKVISKNKLEGKVRTPKFIPFNKAEYQTQPEKYVDKVIAQLGFPMFIKPVDLVSSIGTHHIPDSNTLQTVLHTISHEPWEFEIDEFIDGDLFHCDIIVHNNTIEFLMACKYAGPLAKFSKGSPMGSILVNDERLFEKLKKFSLEILSCLGTFSSAFHLEIFNEKKSGELVFLEAAARTPGAQVPDLYKIIFNQHVEELHYLVQISPNYDLKMEKTGKYAGWITFPKIKGTLAQIKKPEILVSNAFSSFVKSGDEMKQAESLLDSSCSVVFEDEDYQKVEQTFEFLKHYQPLILT